MTIMPRAEELDALVAELPGWSRHLLTLGPLDEPDHRDGCASACGVCHALEGLWTAGPDDESPAARLMDWHSNEVYSKHGHGPLRTRDPVDVYLRCLLIYLAAGWEPRTLRHDAKSC